MTVASHRVEDGSDRRDDELASAIAAGDVSALEVLYARHGALAYSFALRILDDAARAADVVEVAFLDLWRGGQIGSDEPDSMQIRVVRRVGRAAAEDIRGHRLLAKAAGGPGPQRAVAGMHALPARAG
ncbi:MAG TPA: sigma factor [Patescibacteria group bacterium]|nr:sigma factor [Patescibacteria group bacterium]